MNVSLLMIDDHEMIIEGYKSILSYNKLGYNITTVAAHTCQEAYEIITKPNGVAFVMVFIDITLPAYPEKKIHTGDQLIPHIRKHLPEAKIVILTSYTESIIIYQLLQNYAPNGLMIKSDVTSTEFLVAFEDLMNGKTYFSKSVNKQKQALLNNSKVLDTYNRQIITLLSQGIKTKNIHEQLHLSKSAVEKRKASIKEYFEIEKGTDEDILREARKQGLI
jgi:two-component system, NarL family, response regulator NreC